MIVFTDVPFRICLFPDVGNLATLIPYFTNDRPISVNGPSPGTSSSSENPLVISNTPIAKPALLELGYVPGFETKTGPNPFLVGWVHSKNDPTAILSKRRQATG
jgi:hypothetical protein